MSIRQNSDTAYWSGSDWQVVSEIWKNATGGISWNIGEQHTQQILHIKSEQKQLMELSN